MKGRDYFKPFEYPWAYDLWLKHEAMHWLGYEVSMHEDVFDWDTKMTPQEKGDFEIPVFILKVVGYAWNPFQNI